MVELPLTQLLLVVLLALAGFFENALQVLLRHFLFLRLFRFFLFGFGLLLLRLLRLRLVGRFLLFALVLFVFLLLFFLVLFLLLRRFIVRQEFLNLLEQPVGFPLIGQGERWVRLCQQRRGAFLGAKRFLSEIEYFLPVLLRNQQGWRWSVRR